MFARFALLFLLAQPFVMAEDDLLSLMQNIETDMDKNSTTGATKKLEDSKGSPAVLKIFTQEDIAKVQSLYDLLNQVTGVTYEGSHSGRQLINVRGIRHYVTNNKILVLINGFRFTDPIGSDTRLDIVPKEAIKRLEVIKGAGSVLYGSNAYALTINIVTFDGKGYNENEYNAYFGSDSIRGLNLNWFDKEGTIKSFFSLKGYHDGGPRDTYPAVSGNAIDDYSLGYSSGNYFGVVNGENWSMTLGKAKAQRNLSYNLRSAVSETNFSAAGVLPTFPGRKQVFTDWDNSFVGWNYSKAWNEKTSYKVMAKLNKYELDPLFGTYPFYRRYNESEAFEYEFQINHQASEKWNLIFGYNREFYEFHETFSGQGVLNSALGGLNPFLPLPLSAAPFFALPGAGGAAYADPFSSFTKTRDNRSGVYLQSIYKLNDKLSFLAANRRDSSEINTHRYSPKYALVYEVKTGEYLKAIFGKAFRYPDQTEKFFRAPWLFIGPNANLKEENVESWEYNWTKSFNKDKSHLSITHFDLDITGSIRVSNTAPFSFQNLDNYKNKGFEIEWDQQLAKGLKYNLGATFQESQDLGSKTRLSGIPSRLFQLGFEKAMGSRFTLYTSSKYTGEIYFHPTNQDPDFSAYTVHDLGLKYQHKKDRQIALNLYNVFDKKYVYVDYYGLDQMEQTIPQGRVAVVSYQVKF